MKKKSSPAKKNCRNLKEKFLIISLKKSRTTPILFLRLANSLALMDVFQSLAWCAFQHDFKKPSLDAKKKVLDVKKGWHPLIKTAIKDQFVPHDLTLDEDKFFGLITGPKHGR